MHFEGANSIVHFSIKKKITSTTFGLVKMLVRFSRPIVKSGVGTNATYNRRSVRRRGFHQSIFIGEY